MPVIIRCSAIIITIMIRYMLIVISIFMIIFFSAVEMTNRSYVIIVMEETEHGQIDSHRKKSSA